MAIPRDVHIEHCITAPFHVQVQLDKAAGTPVTGGRILLQGQVVRVFRTESVLGRELRLGDQVAFPIAVCERGHAPCGGPAYIYDDVLSGASYMEVYLHGRPPNCNLTEFKVLTAPTDEPAIML